MGISDELVPDAANGCDVSRVCCVIAECLANVANVDINDTVDTEMVPAPYFFEELVSGEDAIGTARKRGEKIEFESAQLYRITICMDNVCSHIDREPGEPKNLVAFPTPAARGFTRTPAKDGFDPSDKLSGAEGLDDIVVSTHAQTYNAIDLLVASCEHDDRGIGAFAKRSEDLEAVDVRQADIEQDEIGVGA